MPFTKVFGTTDGAYSTATNWKPEDVTNPLWSWTASGSGTNEYYLRTAANGNPGFVAQPDSVYINGSAATEGTVGSLTAGQWDYGDNDTLGYSTIYVRLSAAPQDPDDRDPFYVKFYQTPRATEHVKFAPDSASITSATGLDQSGVAIGDFIVEEGYQGSIGSADIGYLYIDPDKFEFNGGGSAASYINIMGAAISAKVYNTASAESGSRGLYLRGTAIAVLDVIGGQVGVATNPGETSTVTTVRVMSQGASIWLGSGVTATNLHVYGGSARLRCSVTTVIHYSGSIVTEVASALTTYTQKGGTFIYQSSGTITTHNFYGGSFDEMQSGLARTISTRNLYAGNGTILRNKEAVTVTSLVENDSFTYSITAGSGGAGGGFIAG
jgi:hypothetical protein